MNQAWADALGLGATTWDRHLGWGSWAPGALAAPSPQHLWEPVDRHATFTDALLARARRTPEAAIPGIEFPRWKRMARYVRPPAAAAAKGTRPSRDIAAGEAAAQPMHAAAPVPPASALGPSVEPSIAPEPSMQQVQHTLVGRPAASTVAVPVQASFARLTAPIGRPAVAGAMIKADAGRARLAPLGIHARPPRPHVLARAVDDLLGDRARASAPPRAFGRGAIQTVGADVQAVRMQAPRRPAPGVVHSALQALSLPPAAPTLFVESPPVPFSGTHDNRATRHEAASGAAFELLPALSSLAPLAARSAQLPVSSPLGVVRDAGKTSALATRAALSPPRPGLPLQPAALRGALPVQRKPSGSAPPSAAFDHPSPGEAPAMTRRAALAPLPASTVSPPAAAALAAASPAGNVFPGALLAIAPQLAMGLADANPHAIASHAPLALAAGSSRQLPMGAASLLPQRKPANHRVQPIAAMPPQRSAAGAPALVPASVRAQASVRASVPPPASVRASVPPPASVRASVLTQALASAAPWVPSMQRSALAAPRPTAPQPVAMSSSARGASPASALFRYAMAAASARAATPPSRHVPAPAPTRIPLLPHASHGVAPITTSEANRAQGTRADTLTPEAAAAHHDAPSPRALRFTSGTANEPAAARLPLAAASVGLPLQRATSPARPRSMQRQGPATASLPDGLRPTPAVPARASAIGLPLTAPLGLSESTTVATTRAIPQALGQPLGAAYSPGADRQQPARTAMLKTSAAAPMLRSPLASASLPLQRQPMLGTALQAPLAPPRGAATATPVHSPPSAASTADASARSLPIGASPATPVLPPLPSPLPAPSPTRSAVQRRAAGPAELFPSLAASAPGLASTALEEAAAALRPAEFVTEAAVEKSAAPAAPPDLDALVERACARMLETLSLEQERRGVTPWL